MSLRTIKKRRKESKTDYLARLRLIGSSLPRIVIRKTNRYMIMQLVKSYEAQDEVLITTNSKEILLYGLNEKFSGSLKSLPAAYLTGVLMAKKIKEGEYIVDIGMAKNQFGGRINAAIKGLIDGGLKINAKEKIFPSDERIQGEHLKGEIKQNFMKVKENILKNGK